MQTHHTTAGLRAALQETRVGRKVAFVPTMGNLHEGHIALTTQARRHGDIVVASIFVNPLQFRPGEDFENYPRTLAADSEKLVAAGVDHLFAPGVSEMYPQAQGFFVEPPPAQAGILDGEARPGHFRGVTTVVMKLFQIVQPDAALFGKKDFQQLMIICNMVRELNLPIEIVAGETLRAADGLALSSRNGYLSSSERTEAPRLWRTLTKVVDRIRSGNRDFPALEKEAITELISRNWVPDYIAVRNKFDLQLPAAHESRLVVLAAARLGSTRLIDNLEV